MEVKIECVLKLIKLIFLHQNVTAVSKPFNQFDELQDLENSVEFYSHAVNYLKLIDQSIDPMKKLLESQAVHDMQEAITFFVSAYQFKIERAQEGIYSMLKLMQCNNNDRKIAVTEAFRKIYLTTDANSMDEHTRTVVQRLMELVKEVPVCYYDDLCSIVANWVSKGTLDNNVISLLWNYVSSRDECSAEDRRIAMDLLYMGAQGM